METTGSISGLSLGVPTRLVSLFYSLKVPLRLKIKNICQISLSHYICSVCFIQSCNQNRTEKNSKFTRIINNSLCRSLRADLVKKWIRTLVLFWHHASTKKIVDWTSPVFDFITDCYSVCHGRFGLRVEDCLKGRMKLCPKSTIPNSLCFLFSIPEMK